MKRKDLFRLKDGLDNVSYLSGVKFAYAIIKNKKMIEQELITLQEIIKPSPEIEEYEKNRIAICEKHCKRDENNQLKIQNNTYDIEDMDTFNKDIEELKKKNKKVLDNRQKQADEYNKLLEEDIEIPFVLIKQDDLPNSLSASQMEQIFEIIE